jgi:hypothetical protein
MHDTTKVPDLRDWATIMERSRMSLDWLAGYELRRGWRGPSPNIVVVVVLNQQQP